MYHKGKSCLFHSLSKEVYNWLSNQPNVKEESITDWLLYSSSKRCPKIIYKAFTRNEESNNGADWECWIIRGNNHYFKAYRFLVQAKKIYNKKTTILQLHMEILMVSKLIC